MMIKKTDSPKFVLEQDYYIDAHGNWVFTASFLQKRGYCCKNACKHCPYGYVKAKKHPKE